MVIWGVLVGMFVANLLTVDAITRSQLEGMEEDNPANAKDALHANLSPEEEALILRCGKDLMLFRLRGPLSFGAAKGISARMGLIQSYNVLILDLTDVPRIGVTATLAIERMVEEARSAGRTLFIAGANQALERRLRQFGVEGVLRPSRLDALQEAAQLI